jgi:hypothetical protein
MDYSASDRIGAGVIVAVFVFWLIFAIVAYVVTAIFLSKVFKKAGVEGWKAWVPIYNSWVTLELGEQPGWLSLLVLTSWIPLVGFVTAIVFYVFHALAAYKIGLKFGKEGVFVLLAIFLPIVWVIWLAVDKTAVWKGTANVQAVPAGPPPVSAPVNPPSDSQQPPSATV